MQNWYHSFQLSRGEYFLGAAHDDVFHPDFARRCDDFYDGVIKVCRAAKEIKMQTLTDDQNITDQP